MQITFNTVKAIFTSNMHSLGHVLFSNPNYGSQASLVGRVGWFDYRNRDHHVHGKRINYLPNAHVSHYIHEQSNLLNYQLGYCNK